MTNNATFNRLYVGMSATLRGAVEDLYDPDDASLQGHTELPFVEGVVSNAAGKIISLEGRLHEMFALTLRSDTHTYTFSNYLPRITVGENIRLFYDLFDPTAKQKLQDELNWVALHSRIPAKTVPTISLQEEDTDRRTIRGYQLLDSQGKVIYELEGPGTRFLTAEQIKKDREYSSAS